MFRRWTFGQVLFVFLAAGFLVTGFWGVSQSKTLLSEKQMKEVQGGASVSLIPLDLTWRPRGAPTNNTVDVSVNLTSPPANGKVIFTLTCSDYFGYCMNEGYEADDDADLKFTTTQPAATGISWGNVSASGTSVEANLGGSPPANLNFTVRVQAHDWGAHGILGAGLYDEYLYLRSFDLVSVPRDDNGNHISDGWRNDNATSYTASDDSEAGPGNNTNYGDGFTVFEEYRGFQVFGYWTDLDPQQKDLLVIDNYNASTPNDGIGAIGNLPDPPFAPQMIWANETSAAWKVNYKPLGQGSGQTDHYAVRMTENMTYPAGKIGQCPQTTPHDGSPLIEIFTNEIHARWTSDKWATVISHVMGHECGHAVDTDHCQKYGYPGGSCIMDQNYTYPGVSNYSNHHELHYRLR